MIFAPRQVQEKCQEQYDDLFITFIDLTKAFDTGCTKQRRAMADNGKVELPKTIYCTGSPIT